MIVFLIFAYLYACAEGWTEGRLWREKYDTDFEINVNKYHIVRWCVETVGIVGMIVFKAHLSVLASILIFVNVIPLYEGFFRIARRDTWFYKKTSKWLLGIPHIHWAYEGFIWFVTLMAILSIYLK